MSCCNATYTGISGSGASEGERFPRVVPAVGISDAFTAKHFFWQLKKKFQSGRNLHELLQSDIPIYFYTIGVLDNLKASIDAGRPARRVEKWISIRSEPP